MVTKSLWEMGNNSYKVLGNLAKMSRILRTGTSIITIGLTLMQVFKGGKARKLNTKSVLCIIYRNFARKYGAS